MLCITIKFKYYDNYNIQLWDYLCVKMPIVKNIDPKFLKNIYKQSISLIFTFNIIEIN